MSTLNVNNIAPESGTTITIGGSGDKVTLGGGGLGIVGVSTFTSSGTWTKATREAALGVTIKRVIVEVQGAGGSGCSRNSTTNNMSGGGAGGYAKKLIDVSSISSSTITVGSGGAGTGENVNGNAGGASSWADGTNTVTGNGGLGGDAGASSITDGGSATGGDVNIQGDYGKRLNYIYANGGNSLFGWGGLSKWTSTLGSSPVGYGSGSAAHYNGTTFAGMDGIVIVTEIAG